MEPYWKIEAEAQIPGVCVQVRQNMWVGPGELDANFCEPDHVISRLLAPRVARSHGGFEGSRSLKIGEIHFWPAQFPFHAHVSQALRQRVVRCAFNRDIFEEIAGHQFDWTDAELRSCLDIPQGRIGTALDWIAREAADPGFASTILIEGIASTVMVELSRHLAKASADVRRTQSGLAPWQLRRISDYVESFSGACPTASQLADLCGISRRHFSRLFKRSTGQNLVQYVGEVRVRKAESLLAGSDLSLKEISHQAGFLRLSHFSTAFRRATGETPTEFRRRLSSRSLC